MLGVASLLNSSVADIAITINAGTSTQRRISVFNMTAAQQFAQEVNTALASR